VDAKPPSDRRFGTSENRAIRVLQSFPHKIGAGRICDTAWHQAVGVAAAGAELTVYPGVVHRQLPASVRVWPTLARGRWRLPYRVLGRIRTLAIHDHIVARRLPKLAGQIDIVHTWPLGARQTLLAAKRLGIPTVLERPNAHTRFAYEVVQRECERIGVALPPDHEHAYNTEILRREEEEYRLADALLCPSEFVVQTFLDQGFPHESLVRHRYGYDPAAFHLDGARPESQRGLTMLFVGVCAVRKGVHFALEAWLRSPASRKGTFLIAGEFLPAYEDKLAEMLAHPSVRVLGHRDDVPDLMRKSDILVLPTIEEGFGLVCVEALASGCVPLVSDACTEFCVHGENALVHHVGDVDALADHITRLDEDRGLLKGLRVAGLKAAPDHTWEKAGDSLVEAYQIVLEKASRSDPSSPVSLDLAASSTCP
jgi:glycosyltransferase involved in cell wall biosynthesis